MSKARKVQQIVQGMPTQDGAGVALKRIIGQPQLRRLDPFLMLDFFGSDKAQEYIAGFPPHPHRGFQTVTYMLEGKMRHRDSVGNEGVIEAGGIQWMNAGRGIIHAEMPEQTEGVLSGFQLWVNLPAAHKMSAPGYQDIKPEDVPVVTDRYGNDIKVLVGTVDNVTGPVQTTALSPQFLDLSIKHSGQSQLEIAEGHNAFVYVYGGSAKIDGQPLTTGQLAVLSNGDFVAIESDAGCQCILVSGAPINEPVVQYGPFVMNTEAEIHRAIDDYQRGVLTDN